MRGSVVLLAFCIAAAVASGGATAQETDEEADEQQPEQTRSGSSSRSLLQRLFNTEPEKPAFDFLTGGMPDRMLYFNGIELQNWSAAAYTGAQWMPASINKDGFILRFTMSDSLTRYVTPTSRYDSNLLRAAIMPGYKFKAGKFELQVLAGVDVAVDTLAIDQRFARLRGDTGARLTADLWWEPTSSLMLQYSVSRTMIDDGLNMRGAAGWRLFDRFWIGPELSYSSDIYSKQHAVGAHLTGFHTAEYEWSIAAGYVEDTFERKGAYARLGIVLRPPRPAFFEN